MPPPEMWMAENAETPLVVCDGMGGLAVLDCSNRLRESVKDSTVIDVLDGPYMKEAGVYTLLLLRNWEYCDCGCWGDVHGGVCVFELMDSHKVEIPDSILGDVNDES